jgi:hypothetical protein
VAAEQAGPPADFAKFIEEEGPARQCLVDISGVRVN